MLTRWILQIEVHIRLYGSCGTDLGRSITEVTDNIHAIGVNRFTGTQPSH